MAKILLVEDDKSLREIYGVRLMAEGYTIISAGDGEEALAVAIKERPDLIVSDVMMPKISGFDMLDILRSTTETKNIKVIMMTALSSEDQRARGEALGADRYLVKSQVGIEDVVRTVHDVLADGVAAPAPVVTEVPVAPAPIAAPTPEQITPTPVAPEPIVATAPQPIPEPAPVAPAPTPVFAPAPQPVAAPAYTPEPVAQAPVSVAQTPAPVTPVAATPEPYVPAFVTPEPVAPAPAPVPVAPITPVEPVPQPVATPAYTPEPVAQAPTPAPAPAFAPAPAAPAPIAPVTFPPSSLPEPTAPFSSDPPASLGDRIINPLPSAAGLGGAGVTDIAAQMNQELNAHLQGLEQPAAPVTPTQYPAPQAPPLPPLPPQPGV